MYIYYFESCRDPQLLPDVAMGEDINPPINILLSLGKKNSLTTGKGESMTVKTIKKNTKKNVSGFSKYFRHWRNKKVYYAKDYGYEVWPFGKKQKASDYALNS